MKHIFLSLTLLAFANLCNAQANTKLSNLVAPTAVNVNLIAGGSTGTKDLGSSAKRWRNGYYNSTVYGYGVGSSFGVYGTSTTYGVYGTSSNSGVYGTGGSYGTYGYSSGGYGAAGVSSSGYGLYGSSSSSWGSVAYGVYGAFGSGTSGYGVEGFSTSSYGVYGHSGYVGVYGEGTSYGTYGYSAYGWGATGVSSGNYGVYGQSYNSFGVYGYSDIRSGGYFYSSKSYGIEAESGGGAWAAVFHGPVVAWGGYSVDASLKKNVQEFPNAMTIINKLRPVNYEYRTDGNFASLKLPEGTHYGLIAQELEHVLPNLVKEAPPLFANKNTDNEIRPSPDGKPGSANEIQNEKNSTTETITSKAINYTELIPILVKAMQELGKQNDDLKTQVATLTQTVSQLTKSNGTVTTSSASINQNFPNPFTKSTVISFNVPQGSSANIIVSQTGSGKVIKTIPLSAGASQLTFDGASLSAGSYSYTLYIDGKKIDTKQMIINR